MKNIFDNPVHYREILLRNSSLVTFDPSEYDGKSLICVFFTKYCGVGCDFCFFKSPPNKKDITTDNRFSEEGISKFIDFANSANLGYLQISGGGEPFLEREAILRSVAEIDADRIIMVILGEFPHLRTIVLSNNKLEKIPNSLRRCKSLKNLYVHEDNINSDFLRLVHGLPMLQSLFVKSKSDLHPEIKVIISQLKNLYFFSKQNKPFFDLRKMKYLEEIDFFNNGLNMENVDFSNLHRLRTLLLCGNKMKEAPTSLQALNKLEYLDFRHNQITDVPKWLIGSSTIKGAYLANNALDERDIYPRHISTNKKDNFSFSEGVKTVLEGMLYRGPQPSLDSVNELNKRGIFHILNLRSDTVNYYEEVRDE